MKRMVLREWQVFLLSLSIYSRVPVSISIPYSEERKNESYKYCGLVGLVVGMFTALLYYLSSQIWPSDVAVVLSMIFSVYITGAFHEDGFADTCDGFGGGMTQERKLAIMKDSSVGAYGVLGVVLILLLKFTLLTSLPSVPVALIVAYVVSRSLAVSFIYTHAYVRQAEQSKLNVAKSPSSNLDFIILLAIALVTTIACLGIGLGTILMIAMLISRVFFSRWLLKHVGGYTGDALGAIQQMSEIICYIILLSFPI
ncbi:adenosylcobinamide-GDP ribazoletransferase [Photobacterium sp. OFAV2-7]|uniref:adenosylcobinamide-GDP ribazoletransferase n=1 Tax=Photobacterium sp. OFAV2-7 TaxID=2917748 RepID=UPI001EF4D6FE|nr:adenosylcobinamide-GDP ribazoletransferase [Photobacterium sp. OFAV2-7]MCG7588786.1 adenosylcobinamide-GDP ribazoletransferase [Photobacterium sp. OFAV2-7]